MNSNKYGHDPFRASRIQKGNQDAEGQMLYALPPWQDTSYHAT